MASRAQAKVTTDHGEIREWAEQRGARPSCVRGTGGNGDIGMLRLDFPGFSGEGKLEEISWEDWFSKFDERGLALLYQDTTARGQKSNFNKIIARETAAARAEGDSKASRRSVRATGRRSSGTRAATARTRSSRSGQRSTSGSRSRNAASARGRAKKGSTRGAASRGQASSRRKSNARSTSRTQRTGAQKKTSRAATGRSRTRRKAA